jgi:hypothetical protein
MRRRTLIVIALAVLVGAGAAAKIAQAEPIGLTCGTVALTVETSEPPTGFTGACLASHMNYVPQLPSVCYSPKAGSVTYGTGFSTCTVPAASAYAPYWTLPASYDSYRVLMTCYPQTPAGTCPQNSVSVSNSCCDYGSEMTSLDGHVASGLVAFQ